MLGKFGAGESLSNAVVADICDLTQPFQQTERLEDGGVNADTDVGVAGFDLLQGRAGREGALRHDRHGQSSMATGIVDVRTELAQGALDSSRRMVWCGHVFFALQIKPICSTKITIWIALVRRQKEAANGGDKGIIGGQGGEPSECRKRGAAVGTGIRPTR